MLRLNAVNWGYIVATEEYLATGSFFVRRDIVSSIKFSANKRLSAEGLKEAYASGNPFCWRAYVGMVDDVPNIPEVVQVFKKTKVWAHPTRFIYTKDGSSNDEGVVQYTRVYASDNDGEIRALVDEEHHQDLIRPMIDQNKFVANVAMASDGSIISVTRAVDQEILLGVMGSRYAAEVRDLIYAIPSDH
ncbi:MAG: hypothetical protein GWN00_01005 [Aliifodinibius sp.]|nr:hypothetical protein [Fodinibius sp.]NIV09909.1 hypothetical protein [Fodinibius sp.]NIY23439.1 hypothetical protein [Fodinibius sp.]